MALDNSGGLELAYCCLNTNARNYAKLGQLLLNEGQWRAVQLLDKAFVEEAITQRLNPRYGLSIWVGEYNNREGGTGPYFSFNGHLGQYIIVCTRRRYDCSQARRKTPKRAIIED